MSPTDACQAHPYHFLDPRTTLAKAISDPVGMPWPGGDCKNTNNRNAYIISEYCGLWVTRDGKPTSVSRNLYANLAGKDAPPSKLFPLAARLLAAETEYWRCRRQAAGVLEFCDLCYSRPDEPTSDHWQDVKHLIWQPEFYRYVRDAFAPVGLMVDFTKERILAGSKPAQVPVIVINDLEQPWHGPVILRLKIGGHVAAQMKQECHLEPWGKSTLNFEVKWPAQTGPCTLEAELAGADGKPVRSLRDTRACGCQCVRFGLSQAGHRFIR